MNFRIGLRLALFFDEIRWDVRLILGLGKMIVTAAKHGDGWFLKIKIKNVVNYNKKRIKPFAVWFIKFEYNMDSLMTY